MIRIVNWNIGFTKQPWLELVDMDADVALLQETCTPPPEVADRVSVNPHRHWLSEHYSLTSFRPARVVKLSGPRGRGMVRTGGTPPRPAGTPPVASERPQASSTQPSSHPRDGNQPIIAVSMYGGWQRPHPYAGPWVDISGRLGPPHNFGPHCAHTHLRNRRGETSDHRRRRPQHVIRLRVGLLRQFCGPRPDGHGPHGRAGNALRGTPDTQTGVRPIRNPNT